MQVQGQSFQTLEKLKSPQKTQDSDKVKAKQETSDKAKLARTQTRNRQFQSKVQQSQHSTREARAITQPNTSAIDNSQSIDNAVVELPLELNKDVAKVEKALSAKKGISAEALLEGRSKLRSVSQHQVLNLGDLSTGSTTKESSISRKLGSEVGGVPLDKDRLPAADGSIDIVGHSSDDGMTIEGQTPQELAKLLKTQYGLNEIKSINLVSCKSEQFKKEFQEALASPELNIKVGEVTGAKGRAAVDRATGQILDEAKVGDLGEFDGHDGALQGPDAADRAEIASICERHGKANKNYIAKAGDMIIAIQRGRTFSDYKASHPMIADTVKCNEEIYKTLGAKYGSDSRPAKPLRSVKPPKQENLFGSVKAKGAPGVGAFSQRSSRVSDEVLMTRTKLAPHDFKREVNHESLELSKNQGVKEILGNLEQMSGEIDIQKVAGAELERALFAIIQSDYTGFKDTPTQEEMEVCKESIQGQIAQLSSELDCSKALKWMSKGDLRKQVQFLVDNKLDKTNKSVSEEMLEYYVGRLSDGISAGLEAQQVDGSNTMQEVNLAGEVPFTREFKKMSDLTTQSLAGLSSHSKLAQELAFRPASEMNELMQKEFDIEPELKHLTRKKAIHELFTSQGKEYKGREQERKDVSKLAQAKLDLIRPALMQAMADRFVAPANVENPLRVMTTSKAIDDVLKKIPAEGNVSEEITAELTQKVRDHIQTLPANDPLVWELTLNSNETTKNMLSDQVGANEVVLNAMLEGIGQGLPNRITSSETERFHVASKGCDVDTPKEFSLKGVTYQKPKYLDSGSFGAILRYTNKDDENDHVVVKVPIEDPVKNKTKKGLRAEAVEEINVHREVIGQHACHRNVIDLKGALKTDDDQLIIVLENAPNGNLHNFNLKLQSALETGAIDKATYDLIGKYMARDVLSGMAHIQEVQGITHFDVKLPNMLLGSDGKAKQTDFGLTKVGREFQLDDLQAENKNYLAPELSGITEFREREDTARVPITSKSDTWSVGIALLELTQPDSSTIITRDIATENTVSGILENPDGFKALPGDSPMEKLVNNLLRGDPSKRMNLGAALQMSMFDDPGLELDELKAIVLEINKYPINIPKPKFPKSEIEEPVLDAIPERGGMAEEEYSHLVRNINQRNESKTSFYQSRVKEWADYEASLEKIPAGKSKLEPFQQKLKEAVG